MAIAALTSIIWGFGFVVAKFGLESYSASQLTALRFLVICPLVIFVPRPRVSLLYVAMIGATLFTGQFILLFFALANGMPPGLASVTQQLQAFFTVALAAAFLKERPTRRQSVGLAIALSGLFFIALTVGSDLRPIALALALGAAFSWSVGNLLVKRVAGEPILPLMIWSSLVPPLPALLISRWLDPDPNLWHALSGASWLSLGAVVYLSLAASFLAYAAWGSLLQRFPASAVAPFALITPCTGFIAAALTIGELFSPVRYVGMALIFIGLLITVLPQMFPPRRQQRFRNDGLS